MLPKWHILLGVVFSLILYFFFNISLFNSSIVFLVSVLIDTDHYLWWVFKKKNFSLTKSYLWMKNLPKIHKPKLDIFHTIEFLIFIGVLSLIYNLFLFVLLGLLFHSTVDVIDLMSKGLKSCKNREFLLTRYLSTKDKGKYL